MRGRGGDPKRVVDYNRFANQFTNQFSSQQPSEGAVTPITAAPSSPRVGTGVVASASTTAYPTTSITAEAAAPGDTPAPSGDITTTPASGVTSPSKLPGLDAGMS